MTRVKICGITSAADAVAACDAGADAIGFNFAEEAKGRGRYIAPGDAAEIAAILPPFVMTVAICVNAPEPVLRDYLKIVDLVQLHGEEPPELCAAVGARAIKAFRMRPGFSPGEMQAYAARAWLLDAYVPGARGGTGQACDWDAAAHAVALGRPLILAGGLTPENVGEAVTRVRPYAVDVSGGVESAPGRKDHGRMCAFVEAVRHASELAVRESL